MWSKIHGSFELNFPNGAATSVLSRGNGPEGHPIGSIGVLSAFSGPSCPLNGLTLLPGAVERQTGLIGVPRGDARPPVESRSPELNRARGATHSPLQGTQAVGIVPDRHSRSEQDEGYRPRLFASWVARRDRDYRTDFAN